MHNFASRGLLFLLIGIALPAVGGELTVSAAASLTEAFQAIGKAYEAGHPGTRIVLNFGASGLLLQQIDSGAPVDVFATADMDTMDQAEARQLIVGSSRASFARNQLVLIAPTGAKPQVNALADLARPAIGRVAISNPDTVPVGRYTRAALVAQGLWAAVEPKMISTQNVRQSLDYVVRGEVDAGFVYATDARLETGKVHLVGPVTTEQPVIYPIAVVRTSKEAGPAMEFIAFVRSAPAQQILQSLGFQEY